jgi:hypothetical protein
VNGFAVEGGLTTIVELAKRDDVARIVANYPLRPLWTPDAAAPTRTSLLQDLDPANWNIDLVDADRVWSELRITGSGAVVAGIDTGVIGRTWHCAPLSARCAGSDHNYNWFDPGSGSLSDGDLGPSARRSL